MEKILQIFFSKVFISTNMIYKLTIYFNNKAIELLNIKKSKILFLMCFFFCELICAQVPVVCNGIWGPPILNQNFGQGNALNNWYGPLATYAPGATTSTTFVGAAGPPAAGGLTDGRSGLVKTPSIAGFGFINTPDHTGNANGLMMLINAPSVAATVFFEYEMNNLCPNTTLRLSVWILNVNGPGTCAGGYQPPNVTLRAVDNTTGNILGTSTTGNIAIGTGWTEYSIVFNNAASSSLNLQIVNNSVGNGCGNDLAIDDITVSPCIPATIDPVPNGDTNLCFGENTLLNFTATLTGNSYNPTEYQWQESTDLGVTWLNQGAPTINPQYVFNSAGRLPGEYRIRFMVGPQGSSLNTLCNAVSEIAVVTISPVPVVNETTLRGCSLESSPSKSLFNLTQAVVTAQPGIIRQYYPSLADAINSSNEIMTPAVYLSPNGTVYIKVSNAEGCFSVAKVNLIVIPPVYSNILKDKIICIEDRTTLDAGPGFDQYEWSTGEMTQVIENIGVGTYWVRLRAGECIVTQTVKVFAPQQPVITGIDIANNSITVNVSGGTPAYQYSLDNILWQDSNVFTGLSRGDHKVFVKDSYDCEPIEITVTVANIINSITPNGDGINDGIDYSALAYKKNLAFVVYSRYGNKIHEGGKLRNYKWDGTSSGRKVSTGTYWYVISWNENDKNSTETRYTGWIMVKNRD